jgi:hypothetical protein
MQLIRWILSLHQLVWFVTGAVSFSVMTYVYQKLKTEGIKCTSGFTFVVLSSLTAVLSVLWSFDSYIENEIRAANMGILLFGGIAVIFALVAHRLVGKAKKTQLETK